MSQNSARLQEAKHIHLADFKQVLITLGRIMTIQKANEITPLPSTISQHSARLPGAKHIHLAVFKQVLITFWMIMTIQKANELTPLLSPSCQQRMSALRVWLKQIASAFQGPMAFTGSKLLLQ